MRTRSVDEADVVVATSKRSVRVRVHRTLRLQGAQHAASQQRGLRSGRAVLTHQQQVAGKIGRPCDEDEAVSRGVGPVGTRRGAGLGKQALMQSLA